MVPRFPISGLGDQLRDIGFERIIELAHGKTIQLADGFSFTSYQISFQDDSVAVVEADGTVLIDLNDAKPLPSSWRTFRAKYPKVDFMLRSHSPAWSYPTRYTFEDPADRLPVDARTYMDAFVAAAQQLRPRYAIPFASGICHLHREVRDENRYLVSGPEMKRYFEANASRAPETALVLLPPGSGWSAGSGFTVAGENIVDMVSFAEQRAAQENERLEKVYRSEGEKQIAFEDFSKYFTGFLKATWLLRPFMGNARWVFPIENPQSRVLVRELRQLDDHPIGPDAGGVRQRRLRLAGGAFGLTAEHGLHQRRYFQALAGAHQARQRDAPLHRDEPLAALRSGVSLSQAALLVALPNRLSAPPAGGSGLLSNGVSDRDEGQGLTGQGRYEYRRGVAWQTVRLLCVPRLRRDSHAMQPSKIGFGKLINSSKI